MTVQHHLRTPLTSMMGYADLLLDGAFGKTPKKITEVIRRFEETTVSLIKMVNDFLDVTQFQLGKEVVSLKDEVNLCPFFKEIFKDLELEANKKGIYLKIEKPEKKCSVKADEPKLRAAIMNIFDNSVKYTKKGGVTVKVEADEKNVKIDIRDTGMGIPKEKLETLFDITFERSEDAKKHFTNGKGIGLYLSSRIIKAHNGKIWAESEGLEKGSVFHIVLPIDKNN
jgi:signal transduction histidine kinase